MVKMIVEKILKRAIKKAKEFWDFHYDMILNVLEVVVIALFALFAGCCMVFNSRLHETAKSGYTVYLDGTEVYKELEDADIDHVSKEVYLKTGDVVQKKGSDTNDNN